MNFRGSTYLPKNASPDVHNTVWFEVHETDNGYAVAKLTGNPDHITQPWDLASRLNFSRKNPQRLRRTLPSSAEVVETLPTVKEAFTALLAREVELIKSHIVFDIGDKNLPRIRHYISLANEGELPSVSLPEEIRDAANGFVNHQLITNIIDPRPKRMVDNMRITVALYNKPAIA